MVDLSGNRSGHSIGGKTMTILVNDKDLKELVETITWGGDSGQVARTLEFTIAQNVLDQNFPVVKIQEGDQVLLQDDTGNSIFGGIIFDIDKTAGSSQVRYLAYDLLFYINGSEITKEYHGFPETIAREVCAELGIPAGTMAETGITITNPCVKKTGYQIIQSSYTAAARQNGKAYQLVMEKVNQVSVIEKGQDSGVILTGDANLSGASYKTTIKNLVNKVLITDKNGKVIGTVEDQESQAAYGTIQKILQKEDDKDANAEAKNMLKGSEPAASVTGFPDDIRAVAGYAVLVQEHETGLIGRFFIDSDSHKYANGESTMDLTLSFQNIMDEIEIEKPDKDKNKEK